MTKMTAQKEQLEDKLDLLVPINGLPHEVQAELLEHAEMLAVRRGQFVFRQGDRDDYTFFLLDGELDLYSDEELVQQMVSGSQGASHALSQLQPRQLSAKARTAVQLLRVDRVMLDQLVKQANPTGGSDVAELEAGDDADWMTRLLQSELFARVPAANIQRIFTLMDSVQVAAGDMVVNQGAIGDHYYIIQSGRCEVTRKTSAAGQPIKLAELGPGATFGEEALVANSRRNATIVMLTDGELMRLTKQDFVELIQKPILSSVAYGEGLELVERGGQWLDVRFPNEHKKGAIEDSLNVPLNVLRVQVAKLERGKKYVIYCDNGSRSSVAAFLMNERGFDAVFLADGFDASSLSGEQADDSDLSIETAEVIEFPPAGITMAPIPASQMTETELAARGKPKAEPVSSNTGATLEADVRASVLKTELAKANVQLQEARRLKQDAEDAKLKAEEFAAKKLQEERQILEQEASKANEVLREAQRLKSEVEAAKVAADAEVEERLKAEQERIRKLEEDSQKRLQQEQQKLEETYRWKTEELEKIRLMKDEAEQQLNVEREKLVSEAAEAHQRLAEAKRIERDVEQTREAAAQEAEARHLKQIEIEERLRTEIKSKIDGERRKLEAEFARNAEQLELAKREKKAAEAARRAAAQEAENIIAEYRKAHEQIRAAEQEKLRVEREHLEAEAVKVREDLETAARAKADADTTRREAEAQLAQLQAHKAQTSADAATAETPLNEDIAAKVAEVDQAGAEMDAAERAHFEAQAAQQANEDGLTRQQREEDELEERFEQEVTDWIDEQDMQDGSDVQQQILANQRQHMERIKRRALEARRAAQQHDQSLLDELQTRLEKDDS